MNIKAEFWRIALFCMTVAPAGSLWAVNYFSWDVESNATSMGPIAAYNSGTTRDCTVAHTGSCSMRLNVIGNDGGDQQMGPELDWNPYPFNVVGAPALYYRWWMRIMPGFRWGTATAKTKSSRVIGGTYPRVYTGYVQANGFNIGECDDSDPVNQPGGGCVDPGPTISYDMRSKADGLWHEYIVMVKPNGSPTSSDAQFKVWVDNVLVGQNLAFPLHNKSGNPMFEAWGGWMARPYFQLNGTVSDGGVIYVDDVATDDTFNSLLESPSAGSNECANWRTAHPEWIFCDDFEGASAPVVGPGGYFEYDNNGGDFVPLAGVGLNGSRGMRTVFQAGEVNAGALHLAFGRTTVGNQGIRSTENFRDVYYRHYLKMQAGWTGNPVKLSRATVFAASDWSQAMIAHLWEGTAPNVLALDPASCVNGAGTVACVGYNDFAHLSWLGLRNGTTPIFDSAHDDTWVCVEAHVKLNDAGQSNGVQEFWIDGHLEARRSDLNFVGSYGAYGINAVFLENYWNSGSPIMQQRWFDNFVVSTQRIGCGTPPIGDTTPPAAPRGLGVQ